MESHERKSMYGGVGLIGSAGNMELLIYTYIAYIHSKNDASAKQHGSYLEHEVQQRQK